MGMGLTPRDQSTPKPEQAPASRDLPELCEALRRHLRLLRQFYWQAFSGGDPDYRGELAAKLRALTCDSQGGPALLLRLMRDMDRDIAFTAVPDQANSIPGLPGALDQPRPIKLSTYLDQEAAALPVPPRGHVTLSRKDLICLWAHDHGARREDWTLHGEYGVLRDLGLTLQGNTDLERGLKETAWTVLHVGEKFLGILEPDELARKAAEFTLSTKREVGGPSLQRGTAFARLGQFEAALAEFQGILEKDPWNTKALNNRALALHHLGRHREAESSYRECVRLDPEYHDPRYNLSCLYALQGRFQDSLAELERLAAAGGLSGRLSPATDPDFNLMRQDREYGKRLRDLLGQG